MDEFDSLFAESDAAAIAAANLPKDSPVAPEPVPADAFHICATIMHGHCILGIDQLSYGRFVAGQATQAESAQTEGETGYITGTCLSRSVA
mgnify:CR=1 FL=1